MREAPDAEVDLNAEQFISRWTDREGGAERANYQMFLSELCDVIGVGPPEPSGATHRNDYVFERAVRPRDSADTTAPKRIDLYKKGCFILEAKQSRLPGKKNAIPGQGAFALDEPEQLGRRSNAKGWDVMMQNARKQGEGYVFLLDTNHPAPSATWAIASGFMRISPARAAPTTRSRTASFRVYLNELRDAKTRELLQKNSGPIRRRSIRRNMPPPSPARSLSACPRFRNGSRPRAATPRMSRISSCAACSRCSPKMSSCCRKGVSPTFLQRVSRTHRISRTGAYGWPVDLSYEEILAKLVALNAERAKEEAAGLVRWLRPDYQIPRFGKQAQDASQGKTGELDLPEAVVALDAGLPAYPADAGEATLAIEALLVAAGKPMTPVEIARGFKRGGKRIEQKVVKALTTLVRYGRISALDDASFVARRAA